MLSLSMSSFFRPMNGANFPSILHEKWKPHLGPSTSPDQTLILDGLVLSLSSDELEMSSSPGTHQITENK